MQMIHFISMCCVLMSTINLLFRFAYLEISTSASHRDEDQAYTAGLGEALLTSDLIKLQWYNTLDGYCTLPLSAYCQRLKKFVDTNAAWVQQQLNSKADVDPYWHQVVLSIVLLSLLHFGVDRTLLCHSLYQQLMIYLMHKADLL